jgi:GNAT superfamily N-acetyltransferase
MAGLADMFAAAPPGLSTRSTMVGEALCVQLPGAPVRELNRVTGPLVGTDVPAVVDFFGGATHTVCGGWGIERELEEHGYAPGYAWMKFERPADASAAAPTDLRVDAVGPDRAEDFALVVQGGFGLPRVMRPWLAAMPGRAGWTCLVAYDGDAPVGGGALFVTGADAWLGLAATLPEARGRGAQSAILARRIALAAEQGATSVTTETGVVEDGRPARSYRNIVRAGFEEAGVRPNWDFLTT